MTHAARDRAIVSRTPLHLHQELERIRALGFEIRTQLHSCVIRNPRRDESVHISVSDCPTGGQSDEDVFLWCLQRATGRFREMEHSHWGTDRAFEVHTRTSIAPAAAAPDFSGDEP